MECHCVWPSGSRSDARRSLPGCAADYRTSAGNYKKDPQKYNKEVTALLEEVIDFNKFARSVMGRYGSDQHYKSLTTEAEKAAFTQQLNNFSTTFKRGIVDTYAKGLFDF